jgi:hypothetical protein
VPKEGVVGLPQKGAAEARTQWEASLQAKKSLARGYTIWCNIANFLSHVLTAIFAPDMASDHWATREWSRPVTREVVAS